MTKVEIELDTLRGWFRKLEDGEAEEVTELIYDTIQELEKKVKDEELGRAKEREAILSTIEPSLAMNQVAIDGVYRVKRNWNFKPDYVDLCGAQVVVTTKGRTKITVRVIEPNNKFNGRSFKFDLPTITHI